MNARDILIAGQTSIKTPELWCQGMQGRMADGKYVSPEDPRAVQRCALGAVMQFAGETMAVREEAVQFLAKAVPADSVFGSSLGYGRVSGFNNSHEHPAVMKLFDDAIAMTPLSYVGAVGETHDNPVGSFSVGA